MFPFDYFIKVTWVKVLIFLPRLETTIELTQSVGCETLARSPSFSISLNDLGKELNVSHSSLRSAAAHFNLSQKNDELVYPSTILDVFGSV